MFVYALSDPCDPTHIRYVGWANDPEHRLCMHLCEAKTDRKTHKLDWLRSLLRRGVKPNLTILAGATNQSDVLELERQYISELRAQGHVLTNATAGGDGLLAPSEETRTKMSLKASQSLRERWKNPNYREKMSAVGKAGVVQYWTTANKEPLRVAQRDRVQKQWADPEQREKLREAARKRWADPIKRAAILEAQKRGRNVASR